MTSGESPRAVRAALNADEPLPQAGTDAGELLRSTTDLLFAHSLFNGHPRFFTLAGKRSLWIVGVQAWHQARGLPATNAGEAAESGIY